MVSVGFFMLKGFIYRKFSIGGDKGEVLDPSRKFGLVFYSEGRQYWNVFKPLLEECSSRGLETTYFTSDKSDPGLTEEIKGMEAIYIGTGREAYFNLNRLNADLVVMTTPGLDVLEIKRSPNVKHYCKISHATGSINSYKAFSVDYFDSVMIGGEGDKHVIRELEELRNLPNKKIEIIGNTYLDVSRKELAQRKTETNFFKDKRPTILISPTWGDHGLLRKYGHKILTQLESVDLYNVIIRPHPQSFISDIELMKELLEKFPENEHRVWNRDASNLESLAQADLMISDFSGIIFDFNALFNKPILTIHSQFEKRGREAMDLKDTSWDIKLLDVIGKTVYDEDVDHITDVVAEMLQSSSRSSLSQQASNAFNMYPGEAGKRGVDFLVSLLEEIKKEPEYVDDKEASDLIHVLNRDFTFNSYAKSNQGSWFTRSLKAIFNPAMLIQIMLGVVLLIGYSFIARRLIPTEGHTTEFLARITPLIVGVLLLLGLLVTAITWFKEKGKTRFTKEKEKLDFKDFLFIAFPLTPIVQYLFANQDILSIEGSIKIFAFFFLVATLLVVLIPWILSPFIAKTVSVSIGLSFAFIVNNMASFGRITPIREILLILIGLCVVIFFILFYQKKMLIIIVAMAFFITSLVTSVSKHLSGVSQHAFETDYNGRVAAETKGMALKHSPDIYLLVYDAYENQETMNTYGIDNDAQYDYLLDQGFAIYDGTYSVAPSSLSSMSRVVNPDIFPDGSIEARRILSGSASVVQKLQSIGYYTRSIHSSDYYTKGYHPTFSEYFPSESLSIAPEVIIGKAILEGEFRFDTEFSNVDYNEYQAIRSNALTHHLDQPEFMYSHEDLPGHTTNAGFLTQADFDLHVEHLAEANTQMRKDIEALNLPGRDAIVIIAGDHGPYLTKNGGPLDGRVDISEIDQLDVQDRYGAFLAISWPNQDTAARFEIKTIQDVMPAILAYMYDDNSLYDKLRIEPNTLFTETTSGVKVIDGIIHGGIDDGKPLFKVRGVRVQKPTE